MTVVILVFIFCSIPTFCRWRKSRKRLQTSLHTQPHISNRLYLLAAVEAHLEGAFSSVILVSFVLNVKMVSRAETLRMTDYQRQNSGVQSEVQRPRVRKV